MYKNVYTIGVFDLFHRGHVELLRRAKALGQNLIVGVNSDEKASIYKGQPICSEQDRLEIVAACKYVDEAFLLREFDQTKYIEMYNIDLIVHGDDWHRLRYLRQLCVTEDYLKQRNTELKFLPYTTGVSTSQLMHRINAANVMEESKRTLFY